MVWPFKKRLLLKDWPQFSIIEVPGYIQLYCVIPGASQAVYDRVLLFADNPLIYGFAIYNFRGYTYVIFARDELFPHQELRAFFCGLQSCVCPNEQVLYATYYLGR